MEFSLFVFLALLLIVMVDSIRLGITPTPSSPCSRKKILELIDPETEGKIYELGSGWGGLALKIAKKCPKSQVFAYDNALIPWLFSKGVEKFYPLPNLIFSRENFIKVSLNEAQVIICYLYPAIMVQLKKKFIEELKPGTLIISHTFAIPNWSPTDVYSLNDLYKTPIYVYIKNS